jgi:hypothetical protein
MVSDRLGLALYVPGTIYRSQGAGRPRDRVLEGALISAQAWLSERSWILGGAGLGFDAPAVYDVKGADERRFYFGLGAVLGAGREVWRLGGFALDLQARLQAAGTRAPEGTRRALALDLLVGANWY